MNNMNQDDWPTREECVGEWVNVHDDPDPWVLERLDLGPDEIESVMNSCLSVSITISGDGDERHDLLWRGDNRKIVPESEWSPKLNIPNGHS